MALQSAGSVVAATPAVVQLNQLYAVVGEGYPRQVPTPATSSTAALGVPLIAGASVNVGLPTTALLEVCDTR